MERADLLRIEGLLAAIRDLLNSVASDVQRLLDATTTVPPDDSDLVEDMEVGTRAMNAMRKSGCKTKGDVRRLGEARIARVLGCGRRTLNEIGHAIGGWPKPWELDKPT